MLICPKCQKTYEEGSQRFCLNDGARLNPQNGAQNPALSAGVFTGILNKKTPVENGLESDNLPPKLFKEPFKTKAPGNDSAREIQKSESPKTFTKLIKPDEIPSGQAPLGDRRVNPVGRVALSPDNPNILLGQTIKGRYFIKSRISQTAHSIKYLASDKLNSDKKVVVRIYTGKLDGSDFSAGIFADERVGLSHINHPNIAKVSDSGELPEGNPFIVSEYVKGISLKENFAGEKKFTLLQTARIIRQAAGALSEAHQNGVLHRNLNPENVILSVSDTGTEQVKITDFNIFSDKTRGEFSYLAPEQISGGSARFSADIFSLGVIAYRMLTGHMPFAGLTSKELYKIQQKGLQILPSVLNAGLSEQTDRVLQKALAFNAAERFQSIRDFGDSIFNVLTSDNEEYEKSPGRLPHAAAAAAESETDDFSVSLDSVLDETSESVETEIRQTLPPVKTVSREIKQPSEIEKTPITAKDEVIELEIEQTFKAIKLHRAGLGKNSVSTNGGGVKVENSWERRSIEPPAEGGRKWTMFSIFGIGLLFVLTAIIFYFFVNRPADPKFTQTAAENQTAVNLENQAKIENQQNINEIPPAPRKIEQPEGTVFFENSKENLSKELLKNYRGFYFYYPKDWKRNKFDKNRNKVEDKFIDISKTDADGIPLEQFMVSFYESEGTFDLDKPNFPAIVAKASEDLKNSPLPNFQLIGSGSVNLNQGKDYEGWKAYEMKFQGEGTAMSGDKIKLFGRRFYIPAARPGVKKGLVITLLATSLSKDVQSANDLGEKGDLKTILSTFEPDQNF